MVKLDDTSLPHFSFIIAIGVASETEYKHAKLELAFGAIRW